MANKGIASPGIEIAVPKAGQRVAPPVVNPAAKVAVMAQAGKDVRAKVAPVMVAGATIAVLADRSAPK